MLSSPISAAESPFATSAAALRPSESEIDALVAEDLKRRGIEPAELCSDAVFVRRVYLDVVGRAPTMWEAKAFLADHRPGKRALLIDKLLDGAGYANYWTLKWCDILRVKSEFPIRLWPNAVQAYSKWIHDALRSNMPYNEFARKLLTSSGSDFREPPVNFYRAVRERTPSGLAATVALTFMGTRFDKWPEGKRAEMEKFFSRVAYKKTAEWKEEIVYNDPAADTALNAELPDGTEVVVEPGADPRIVFADWLLKKDNPWFAKNIVNRIWCWLLGRGIIHEPDDIRLDNPPSNPALLKYLESELVSSGYDLKHIYRLILKSGVYQQSCVPKTTPEKADKYFARYIPRRLPAEVLADMLHQAFGGSEKYSSLIPEPYTFVPAWKRSVTLNDGSITSEFLEMFGRPPRDTGLEEERRDASSKNQRLYMLNSTHIQKMIRSSGRLRSVLKGAKGKKVAVVRRLYLHLLSRYPTRDELDALGTYAKGSKTQHREMLADLAWALVNSKEFQFKH